MQHLEIYDSHTPVFNVMAQAVYPDANFTYIGFKSELTKRAQDKLKRYFKIRGAGEPNFVVIKGETVNRVEEALAFLENGEKYYIELRGGAELIFVVLGSMLASTGVSVFRVDPASGKAISVTGALPDVPEMKPDIKLEQLILLANGAIGDDTEDLQVELTDDLKKRVRARWARYSAGPKSYNYDNGAFAEFISNHSKTDSSGRTIIDPGELCKIPAGKVGWLKKYINRLSFDGLVTVEKAAGDGTAFRYKNEACRELVNKTGLLLELFVRSAAAETGRFSDVRQGVRFDWDGTLSDAGAADGTTNEIDVVLVCNFTVFYISCKSGQFDRNALYELDAVANRFDVGNLRKILICKDIDQSNAVRARDMNIKVISDIGSVGSLEDMAAKLNKLAKSSARE